MHMVIRAIVYAKTKEGAFDKAKKIFDQLVESQVFDYYATFDPKEQNSSMAGIERWGEFPMVAKLKNSNQTRLGNSTPEPQQKTAWDLVEEAMNFTKEEFLEKMDKIRESVSKFDNETLFENKEIRYWFWSLGQSRGCHVWLYDQDGEGITSQAHLQRVLEKWKGLQSAEKEYEDKDIFVVPADVHY